MDSTVEHTRGTDIHDLFSDLVVKMLEEARDEGKEISPAWASTIRQFLRDNNISFHKGKLHNPEILKGLPFKEEQFG